MIEDRMTIYLLGKRDEIDIIPQSIQLGRIEEAAIKRIECEEYVTIDVVNIYLGILIKAQQQYESYLQITEWPTGLITPEAANGMKDNWTYLAKKFEDLAIELGRELEAEDEE